MIPPTVLDRGERAFVSVLRRLHPDASFVLRDVGGRSVGPFDTDVTEKIAGRATVDLNLSEEPGENVAAIGSLEAVPEIQERSTGGQSRDSA